MEDRNRRLTGVARRSFLVASGGLVAAAAASTARLHAQPAGMGEVVARWDAAPTIPLWPGAAPGSGFKAQELPEGGPPIFLRNVEQPFLKVFRPKKPNGRSLLSMPGGAYTFVSIANEGEAIAQDMTARGYTVFVLVYRLPGEGWSNRADVPLQDAQRAVRLIRARSAEFGCDPEQVFAVGFSAGGHLGATLATGFDEAVYAGVDAADSQSAKPRAVGLIYPVISQAVGIGHAESTLRLLGPNPTMLDIVRRSPDIHVGEDTPPIFLVHAIDDPAVPLENSMLMLGAMRGARRPVEAHFFERGGHGFGPGAPGTPASAWLDLFANWIDSHAA